MTHGINSDDVDVKAPLEASKSVEQLDEDCDHDEESANCCCDPPVCCCADECCCHCQSCQPFKDWYLFSAQLSSIVGLLLSWYWYIPLILSTLVATFLQLTWCCRMRKGGVWTIAVLSGMNFVANTAAATIMKKYCVETLTLYDHAYVPHDFYNLQNIGYPDCYDNTGLNIIASLSAVISGVVTVILGYFLLSGRHELCANSFGKQRGDCGNFQ